MIVLFYVGIHFYKWVVKNKFQVTNLKKKELSEKNTKNKRINALKDKYWICFIDWINKDIILINIYSVRNYVMP